MKFVVLILLASIGCVNGEMNFYFYFHCLVLYPGQQKMMKIFGKVLDVDLDEVTIGLEPVSNFKCVDDCFQTDGCILVFMNSGGKCFSFDFNSTKKLTVVETKREEGLMVAFKTRFLLDQCPAYDDMDLLVTVGEDPIPWIKNGNMYTFEKCVRDWKMYTRENGVTVCMQTFKEEIYSLVNAIKRCDELGGYKLTGVQSKEELQWIFDRRTSTWHKNSGFWINAKRLEEYSRMNDTHFNITDGYTTLDQEFYRKFADLSGSNIGIIEDCLLVCNAAPGFLINDIQCSDYTYAKGFVCGYQLV
ncbi:hypothetical protein CRE_29040 [Caenorhabditis remanei]|uniref:PAN-3 domain-containing protein n=1 Tax=Caenorhabditis remanei TaxID=31234 RepID=E3NA52_CAERE|nr:hypothetical protein CRE_29040 [Caenorhabditis remanei]